jgi:mannose/fructose-specific phosphotransferase system component IIA
MTRSEDPAPVCAVLIGQGSLPGALLEAAAAIVGDVSGAAVVSNTGCSLELLDRELDQATAGFPAGCDIVIFSDLFGSSCSNASRDLKAKRPGAAVIYGTNLPMLIRFFKYRGRKPFRQLVDFLVETGRESVSALND